MWECRSAWGQEMGEKPSRGLSCFNSLDPQSRESTGSPERTSGGSNWQGLKASSETDLMDEGALERNGVLLSTEKYRGGALTEQVQSAPFPTAVSLLFWLSSLGDRLIGKVQIP